ncbi:MAG TPA: Asp-tRNA(Asn)/Glu-tRNA(Gln) amidotransferase subunit GatB [Patescibacteria group bacterium]|nr:Asp-tRNA(Asn)/Glu-tRNA(Gln) amidotransferase subunit GatB [Patescibacteria group bacterium]
MKQNNNQAVIGLEIHVELKTKSKMFCHCSADYFGHQPNTHACPVCLGLPGALPVANKQAIEWTIMAGLAFGCQISLFSKFDRKNYFYPDLPKGYQISQYDLPFCLDGKMGRIGIKRVHLEEDTAKLIHTKDSTLIDFNRSGVPLMEIVTEPDIESAQEAKEFLKRVQQILRYLDISDCDMEKGSMRLEVNISVRKKGDKLPDYKVEIKNLNSFRFVEKAINYEIKRQLQLIKKGEKPIQETRGWNEAKQKTYTQRWKEEAQDYRYFPEPDLPPIRWKKSEIERIKKLLPELPEARKRRFMEQYGLSDYQATISTASIAQSDYFEEAVNLGKEMGLDPIGTANIIINKRVDVDKTPPAKLVRILVEKKAISKISDKQLGKIVKDVIKKNKQVVADFKKGKTQAVEALLGQVMRETKGAANPNQTRKILLEKLKRL